MHGTEFSSSPPSSSPASAVRRSPWRSSLARVDDRQLLERLEQLVAERRALAAELLARLGEVDACRLYVQHATSSMFAYCTERLGLAESTAYRCIRVARLAREVPEVLEFVATGRLNLSGLTQLAPHVRSDNASELLEAAAGKSTREIEQLLAERFPRPEVASLLRKLPQRRARDSEPRPAGSCSDEF